MEDISCILPSSSSSSTSSSTSPSTSSSSSSSYKETNSQNSHKLISLVQHMPHLIPKASGSRSASHMKLPCGYANTNESCKSKLPFSVKSFSKHTHLTTYILWPVLLKSYLNFLLQVLSLNLFFLTTKLNDNQLTVYLLCPCALYMPSSEAWPRLLICLQPPSRKPDYQTSTNKPGCIFTRLGKRPKHGG